MYACPSLREIHVRDAAGISSIRIIPDYFQGDCVVYSWSSAPEMCQSDLTPSLDQPPIQDGCPSGILEELCQPSTSWQERVWLQKARPGLWMFMVTKDGGCGWQQAQRLDWGQTKAKIFKNELGAKKENRYTQRYCTQVSTWNNSGEKKALKPSEIIQSRLLIHFTLITL